MIRVMTVLGTRPEIVRLSRVIPAFDAAFDHHLVHTGQNAAALLRDVFLTELRVRTPDVSLEMPQGSPAQSLAALFVGVEQAILSHRPQAMLILGDTHSALACLVARRHGVPVYHMEAGNRCFDRESPEEANRRVVDHASDINLPYTEAARANLLREGLPPQRIYVTGSPLFEVIDAERARILASDAVTRLGLTPGAYLLASLHRQESIDRPARLADLLRALGDLHEATGWPVLLSTHPRTRDRLERTGLAVPRGVQLHEPFGFLDWCRLQMQAACVISDSGTVAEEAAMLGFRAVTPRRSMERPEALERGGVILCGTAPDGVRAAVLLALNSELAAQAPPEYAVPDVSRRVATLVAGTCGPASGWA